MSTYPPRQCGIATFTRDLRDAVTQVAPDLELSVCAVDRGEPRTGPDAEFVLRQDERGDYVRAARAVARSGAAAVVIEHEYGIYGGPDGEWIALFAAELDALGVPYLVTLHTVLSQPSIGQAAVLRRLCRRAFAVSVFTDTARRLAIRTGVPADRIVVVPHGAPTILYDGPDGPDGPGGPIRPEVATIVAEAAAGTRLLSTFGLVSASKGLETAIAAVAAVAPAHPDVRYIIASRTHPEIARHEGEAYRDRLTTLIAELGVERHVTFIDHFLTDAEIALLLRRTEVFLTPYRSREQVSSGALTFAVAAGCAAVSTSYHYARDLLSGGAGTVVEPGDATGFAAALHGFLGDPERLLAARAAAARAGGHLSWPMVARRFAGILRAAARPAPAAPASANTSGADPVHGIPRSKDTTFV
ncbi:MAG: glycosyltransferase [Catenulispora sp.]